eukprot:5663054-Lingulodinium_polyedra.AAC.1
MAAPTRTRRTGRQRCKPSRWRTTRATAMSKSISRGKLGDRDTFNTPGPATRLSRSPGAWA